MMLLKNEKGFFEIVDMAISAIFGLIFIAILFAIAWPLANNFLSQTVNVPNYGLWRPAADAIWAIIILGLLAFVMYKIRPQQPQYPQY